MKKWTKALRSGNYDQGTGTLLDDGHFCCLKNENRSKIIAESMFEKVMQE